MTVAPATWRELATTSNTADWQLAASQTMLADSHGYPVCPTLRWYTMTPVALILGAGQPLSDVDAVACRQRNVRVHKRASGGTAVLALPDMLMLDVALPVEHALYRGDVTASYRWVGAAWQATLAQFGLVATLVQVDEARHDRETLDALTQKACYGGQSPYEVLVNGRKVVGLSQVRRRRGAVIQCGVYRTFAPADLAALLAFTPDERDRFTRRLAARVASLADVQPQVPSLAAVRRAFAAVLREQHGVVAVLQQRTAVEQQAQAQARARFAPLDLV